MFFCANRILHFLADIYYTLLFAFIQLSFVFKFILIKVYVRDFYLYLRQTCAEFVTGECFRDIEQELDEFADY